MHLEQKSAVAWGYIYDCGAEVSQVQHGGVHLCSIGPWQQDLEKHNFN